MAPSSLDLVITTALEGRMKDLRTRQRILRDLHTKLTENVEELVIATARDDRISREEAQVVVSAGLLELRAHYDRLDLKDELDEEYSIARKESRLKKRVPSGMVYVIPEAYTTFFSIITALSAAIAAGNCVVIEMQDSLARSPRVLRRCLQELQQYTDSVTTVSQRPGPEFLRHCLLVEQAVEEKVSASSECLRVLPSIRRRTVAIVDRTADASVAAREIVASQLLFQSQGRYSVDQVFVNEYVLDDFYSALTREAAEIATRLATRVSNLKDRDSKGAVIGLQKPEFPVLQISDRSDSRLHQRQHQRGFIIHKVTSLDDAIDTVCEGRAAGALYLFAGYDEAKYLSQYIPSQATFVNHIPPELQIGPAYPEGFETSVSLRYTREMFETPRPERVDTGKVRHSITLCDHITAGKTSAIVSRACQPLKATGQGRAGAMDFFLQGMIFNLVTCVLPLTALSLYATSKGIGMLYQRFLKL
ncbi:hypothetical protein PMG11_11250 [Penicillium brasilianum]|uniref:Aldehyde dehydrogenase domain-containing protein n=1 Tax=Penicillium brasilianum TaxID=104259 RepID=A0A0F7U1A4_PENBI|nr:hypothetical protein PMG11_11250 [Penicillium brasilianum]